MAEAGKFEEQSHLQLVEGDAIKDEADLVKSMDKGDFFELRFEEQSHLQLVEGDATKDEADLVKSMDKVSGIVSRFARLQFVQEEKTLFVQAKINTTMNDLPCELLVEIAKRLKNIEDFTCFRSVSRSFNVSVQKDYFEGPLFRHSLPYLLLPSTSRDGIVHLPHMIYSLVNGESVVRSLVIRGMKANDTVYFESLGWLLTVDTHGKMSLIDPFSSFEISVPNLNTLPKDVLQEFRRDKRLLIHKMALSSRPNEKEAFVLLVIISDECWFWRLGDKAWNRIDDHRRARDVVYGGSRFYSVSSLGFVNSIEYASGLAEFHDILPFQAELRSNAFTGLYIVKSPESLLVIRRIRDSKNLMTNDFEVFQVDIEGRTITRIWTIGELALFVGCNSSIALDATAHGGVIKANHIYFTDDLETYKHMLFKGEWKTDIRESPSARTGLDNGIYNLETGHIESIRPVKSLLQNVCPAMWITPNAR